MDPWTTTDVQTLLDLVENIDATQAAIREAVVGVLFVASFIVGWYMGGVMAPSASEMAWDGR